MGYKNREEQLAYQRRHYRDNKAIYKKQVQVKRQNTRQRLAEYKSALGCSKCSETHSACLEFHHTNSRNKVIAIGESVNENWSWDRILTEIEKCIILCANCHRKLHYNEKNISVV